MLGNHTSVVNLLHFPETLCKVVMRTNYEAFDITEVRRRAVCLYFLLEKKKTRGKRDGDVKEVKQSSFGLSNFSRGLWSSNDYSKSFAALLFLHGTQFTLYAGLNQKSVQRPPLESSKGRDFNQSLHLSTQSWLHSESHARCVASWMSVSRVWSRLKYLSSWMDYCESLPCSQWMKAMDFGTLTCV